MVDGTGILSGDFVVPKAGSPTSGLHFDSQTQATLWLSFRPIFLDKKIGRNWNRTSDTRIFRLVKALPPVSLNDLK
ncbi:MAG TPA: hypothetical protein VHK67_03200 [Rhabdochlamydiaceae bacterium]|nr:hypothetical protein [Rhabdochlamydiaceae bacterium]